MLCMHLGLFCKGDVVRCTSLMYMLFNCSMRYFEQAAVFTEACLEYRLIKINKENSILPSSPSLPPLPFPPSLPPSLFPFLNCVQPLWWRWCSWSMLAISRVWASPEAWGITVERRGRKGQSCLSFISLEATRRNRNNPHQTLESLLHSSNYGAIPL